MEFLGFHRLFKVIVWWSVMREGPHWEKSPLCCVLHAKLNDVGFTYMSFQ